MPDAPAPPIDFMSDGTAHVGKFRLRAGWFGIAILEEMLAYDDGRVIWRRVPSGTAERVGAMIDLEKLIGEKQDRLRGRPRDRLDDFQDWRRRLDVETLIGAVSLVLAGSALAVIGMVLMVEGCKPC